MQIKWRSTRAFLELRGNFRKPLDMSVSQPVMRMQSTKPKIQIDQSEPFAEAGMKRPEQLMIDHRNYARQMLQQSIARRVSNGNQMMNFQNGRNVIAEIADHNAYGAFEKEFVYGWIPKSRPRISATLGKLSIQVEPGQVQNRTEDQKIDITYHPWNIKYYTE